MAGGPGVGGAAVPGIGRPYSRDEIAGFLKAAGFPESIWPTMIGIAYAESSGYAGPPHARNPQTPPATQANGYVARGLFQIRNQLTEEKAIAQGYYDGAKNTVLAKSIYESQGLKAWQTYTNGDYKDHVPDLSNNPLVPDVVEGPVDAVTGAVSGAVDALNPATWFGFIRDAGITTGMFIGGGVLMVAGVWLIIAQTKVGKSARSLATGLATTVAAPEVKGAQIAGKVGKAKAVAKTVAKP